MLFTYPELIHFMNNCCHKYQLPGLGMILEAKFNKRTETYTYCCHHVDTNIYVTK